MRSKARSLLTTLGVIIGVAAVIATVAMGEGARARVEQAFSSLGTNLLIVLPGSTSAGGVRGGAGSRLHPDLGRPARHPDRDPQRALRGPAAAQLRPRWSARSRTGTPRCYGTTADYFGIRQWSASLGSVLAAGRRRERQQDRGAGPDRGRPPVRPGRRSRRALGAHPRRPVHRGRRAGAQGPVGHRARTTTTASTSRSRPSRPASRAAWAAYITGPAVRRRQLGRGHRRAPSAR